MKLQEQDIENLAQLAEKAALAAGHIIRQYIHQNVDHHLKDGLGSLAAKIVTEVDLLSQQIILELLSESIDTYDLGLLTEESADNQSRLRKDYFWCIDPMDGTLYFQQQKPGYAVSIALVSQSGKPILGVIYDPYYDNLYQAIDGQTIQLNHKALEINDKDNESLTIFCDNYYLQLPRYQENFSRLTKAFNEMGYPIVTFDSRGGAVKNALSVLENAPACYLKLPKEEPGCGCVWDYAATSCFFNYAQQPIADITGKTLDLNPKGSLYFNHCGVVFSTNQKIADCIYENLIV